MEAPVLDLTGVDESNDKRREIIRLVDEACRNWGFFQIRGHGVSQQLLDDMVQAVESFFSGSSEVKAACPGSLESKFYYVDMRNGFEETQGWQEMIFQNCYPDILEDSEVPESLINYVKLSRQYSQEIRVLAFKLMNIFSECLGLETGKLERMMTHTQKMRINYYPPPGGNASQIGIMPHSDPGTFTILQQHGGGEQGLEILHNGTWTPVKRKEGAFVINVADQLEILTNGRYKSVEHRALVPSSTRISIASFISPSSEDFVAPLETMSSGQEEKLYKRYKFSEYMANFMATAKLDGKAALEHVKA